MQKPDKKKRLIRKGLYNTVTKGLVYDCFEETNELFRRAVKFKELNKIISMCCCCSGLNWEDSTENAPGFGSIMSKIVLVGQSLCTKCMATQIPFTMASGYAIDAVLFLSKLSRYQVYITNLVKCHPPGNRASSREEKNACMPYLKEELQLIRPRLVIALGTDAKKAIARLKLPRKTELLAVRHPASFIYSGNKGLLSWIENLSNVIDKYQGD